MLLVDVHAHMELPDFDNDLDEVLKRAEQAGVKAIINNTTKIETINQAIGLSKKYPILKIALGLHPQYIKDLSEETINQTLDLIKTLPAVAIGEIGLDYHYHKDNKEKQIEVFRRILDIAQERKLPVIVHSWDSAKDVFATLEPYKKLKVIIHCFQGRKSQVKEGLSRGYYFSIPTSITRNTTFQYIVETAPMSKLLTETDAPFQSANREDRNEPANIKNTIKEIAKIKSITEEEVANLIFQNYQTLF